MSFATMKKQGEVGRDALPTRTYRFHPLNRTMKEIQLHYSETAKCILP